MGRLNWLVIIGITLWAGPLFAAIPSIDYRSNPISNFIVVSSDIQVSQMNVSHRPFASSLLAQANSIEKKRAELEKRNKELALEYQKIAEEAATIKTARQNMKSDVDRRLYNDRIEELNKMVREYEKKRAVFEKDVQEYQKEAQPQAAAPPPGDDKKEKQASDVKKIKQEEPAYTGTDIEVLNLRNKLQEREKVLNQEYQELMEEREAVEKAVAEADAGTGDPVPPETVKDLNIRIEDYDARRAALNAEIEVYNQKVKKLTQGTKAEEKKDE